MAKYSTFFSQILEYESAHPEEFPITAKTLHVKVRPDLKYSSVRAMVHALCRGGDLIHQGYARANGPGRPPSVYSVRR